MAAVTTLRKAGETSSHDCDGIAISQSRRTAEEPGHLGAP